MIMCNIIKNFNISIEISKLSFGTKISMNYQDFTAVFVKYANMEGFCRAGHIYMKVNSLTGVNRK